MTETPPFTLKTLFWGLIVPILIALLIIAFPTVIAPATSSLGLPFPLHLGFAQMVIFGIPLLLGLNWNQWAGGASGFLLGTLWYLSYASYFTSLLGNSYGNFFTDVSFVGYIVTGILIGYIAGALSNKSYRFKRMLGAGLTAAITAGFFQYFLVATVAVPFLRDMTLGVPQTIYSMLYGLFTTVFPFVIIGLIIPVVAKISYGSEISHP